MPTLCEYWSTNPKYMIIKFDRIEYNNSKTRKKKSMKKNNIQFLLILINLMIVLHSTVKKNINDDTESMYSILCL